MPELLKNEAISLSDSDPKFTVHLKDGSTDLVEVSELGNYFENNTNKLKLQKLTPRRLRLIDYYNVLVNKL